MTIQAKRNVDMTEGALFKKLILFVLPLMATNLLQCFYNAADMIVVSLSPEGDAVGAIGIAGPFVNMVLNIFIGFSMGANVVVARALGAHDEKSAGDATHTAIAVSAVFGVVGGLIGILATRPILMMMGAEERLLDLAVTYTVIYFAGVPFLALTNYTIAVLRAKGDTQSPLIVLALSGLVNVLLNLMFVMVFRLSVEGVALATAISNVLSAVLLLFLLSKDEGPCRFSLQRLQIEKRSFLDILKIGVPAGIQGSLFSISNMVIQSSILQVNNAVAPAGSAFEPVVKGNSAGANLESFCYTTADAVSQGAVSFVGQNNGARKPDRIGRVMGYSYLLAALFSSAMAGLIYLLHQPLLALYGVVPGDGGSLDSIAYGTALLRMQYLFIPYFTLACMNVGSSVVRGLGKSTTAAVITLIGVCVFRVVWLTTVFPLYPTLDVIYISYPISWAVTAVALFLVSELSRQKMKKEIRKSTDA